VLPNEVFDLFREVVVHRHASTSHAPLAPATPPLNGYGTLPDWERIAERSPFVLDEHGVLVRRSEVRAARDHATNAATAGSAHGPLRTLSSPQ